MLLEKKRKQDFTTMKERQKPCSSTLSPGKDRRYCISSEMELISQYTFDFFFMIFIWHMILWICSLHFSLERKIRERVDIWEIASKSEGELEASLLSSSSAQRCNNNSYYIRNLDCWLHYDKKITRYCLLELAAIDLHECQSTAQCQGGAMSRKVPRWMLYLSDYLAIV